MKKAKLNLLAGLAMAVSLTGCQKKEVKPGDVAGYDEGEQYLSIWVHSIEDTQEGQVYRESVDSFNEKYNGKYFADIEFIPRNDSGVNADVVCVRKIEIAEKHHAPKLHFIMDRYSVELFVNDGEQTASVVIPTPLEANEMIVSHSPIDVPVHILIQIEPPRSNQDYGEQITVLYGLSGSAAV